MYAADPEQWADSDVIRVLLAHGHDAIGNLLIGEQAREHFLEMPEPTSVERATAYPALALAAGAGEAPASPAGGTAEILHLYKTRSRVSEILGPGR